jgi:hypothetical protein
MKRREFITLVSLYRNDEPSMKDNNRGDARGRQDTYVEPGKEGRGAHPRDKRGAGACRLDARKLFSSCNAASIHNLDNSISRSRRSARVASSASLRHSLAYAWYFFASDNIVNTHTTQTARYH